MKFKNILLSGLALALTYSCETPDDVNDFLTIGSSVKKSFKTVITDPSNPKAYGTLTAQQQTLYTSYWDGTLPTNVILDDTLNTEVSLSPFQTDELKGKFNNNKFVSGSLAISSDSGLNTLSSSFTVTAIVVFKKSDGTSDSENVILDLTIDDTTNLSNIPITLLTNDLVSNFFNPEYESAEFIVLTGTESTNYETDFGINSGDIITFTITLNLETDINTSGLGI